MKTLHEIKELISQANKAIEGYKNDFGLYNYHIGRLHALQTVLRDPEPKREIYDLTLAELQTLTEIIIKKEDDATFEISNLVKHFGDKYISYNLDYIVKGMMGNYSFTFNISIKEDLSVNPVGDFAKITLHNLYHYYDTIRSMLTMEAPNENQNS